MTDTTDVDLLTAARRSPAQTAIFVALPVALAIVQLGNALLNGFPVWAAGLFAVVMIGYAAMYARLHTSRVRLDLLEYGSAA